MQASRRPSHEGLPAEPTSGPATAEGQRYRLFEAFTGLLQALSIGLAAAAGETRDMIFARRVFTISYIRTRQLTSG
jgi:hypothetical protein